MVQMMLKNIKRFFNLKDRFFLAKDVWAVNSKPKRYPKNVVLSLSNFCNLSCPICSINNLKGNKVKRVINHISLEQIKAFDSVFRKANNISFLGFIGESILNPEFVEIIRYLKLNYNIWLHISTNGIGANRKVQDTMIEVGFDEIHFSIHAATAETYKILQGKDFNMVINNLASLQKMKEKKRSSKPYVTIVYALNKANIQETKQMIDITNEHKVRNLYLYHYRDYGIKTLSLDKEPDFANKMIDDIYSYAKDENVISILPKDPPYYRKYGKVEEDKYEIKCNCPWNELQMKSSYSHKDSYYLGCCNTFNPFLFNYNEHIDRYGEISFDKIWYHPVFQYLRETVNSTSKSNRNPLCKYCKSKKRDLLKDIDNKKNYEIKLQVIDEFFKGFSGIYKIEEDIAGLRVLYTEDEELRAMA